MVSAEDKIASVLEQITNKRWREISARLEMSTSDIMDDKIVLLQVITNEIKRSEDGKEHWRVIDEMTLFEMLEFLGVKE